MSLVQTFNWEFAIKDGKQKAIFNPFANEKLIDEDPNVEPPTNYSDTVMLVYSMEYISEGPFYSHPDFDSKAFEALEDVKELSNKIEALNDNFVYLILTVAFYGNDPGDFGGHIFVFRQNHVF